MTGAAGLDRLVDQRGCEGKQLTCDDAGVAAQPLRTADQAGDLIVAGTEVARSFAAEPVACDLSRPRSSAGLVLVVFDGRKTHRSRRGAAARQPGFHAAELIGGQQACAVRARAWARGTGDVVIGESPVELRGFRQTGQLGRRSGSEAQ